MAKAEALTFHEFNYIGRGLAEISSTWFDLWMLVFYTEVGVGRLISLKYDDLSGEYLTLRKENDRKLLLTSNARALLYLRRLVHPDDVYIFQSRSNRVKSKVRAVSIIAFNSAIKRVAVNVTGKNVSSSSAIKTRGSLFSTLS